MKRTKWLASEAFKDVVAEVLDETSSHIKVLWYNVGLGHEPWVIGSSKRLAIEELPRERLKPDGSWWMFDTIDKAKAFVNRR